MKAMDLLVGFGSVKDSYVIGAEEFRQGKQKAQIKRLSTWKAWLIAAVIALMLLFVGCAVVYVLRLQDMRVGEKTITQEAWYGPAGEYVPPTEWVSTQLSLQGYNSSPEQLALREWLDFQAQYDTDYTLLNENNHNESGVPDQYYITYDCYTFEMMDKLNEILDKYNLKPLGAWIFFQRWETPLFYEALQLDSLCCPDADVERMAGYFSPEGSFHTEFLQTLEGEREDRIVTYTYAKNQYLYPYYFSIGNIELWEQWHYTTADGTDVLLATYENALIIICDCGDGFIHISTENNMPNSPYENTAEPMTRQEAEEIADSFNYSIHPQPCTPAEVEAMRGDYPMPEKQTSPYIGFRITLDGRWFPREEIADTFEHYIDFLLANSPNAEELEYCIVDLDSDGEQEIIVGRHDTGRISQIIKMDYADPDSEKKEVSYRYLNGYIYDGPVLESIDELEYDDCALINHFYRDCSGNLIEYLRYNTATKMWERETSPENPDIEMWVPITGSEAKAIQNVYTPISFDMKPLSQFSMNKCFD